MERKNHYLLHKQGLNSTELFGHRSKICIRSNSSGGEHLVYISIDSEQNLLSLFESTNFFNSVFKSRKNTALEKTRQEKAMKFLAEKFTYGEEDPYTDIIFFFKRKQY